MFSFYHGNPENTMYFFFMWKGTIYFQFTHVLCTNCTQRFIHIFQLPLGNTMMIEMAATVEILVTKCVVRTSLYRYCCTGILTSLNSMTSKNRLFSRKLGNTAGYLYESVFIFLSLYTHVGEKKYTSTSKNAQLLYYTNFH